MTDTVTPLSYFVRVLLADAALPFVAAVTRMLALDPNLALVGSAVTGADTLRQAADLRPDLVLVDIGLRDMSGLHVTRTIKGWPNAPKVVLLSLSDGAEYVRASRSAGADAFVTKHEFYDEVSRLIHAWYVSE